MLSKFREKSLRKSLNKDIPGNLIFFYKRWIRLGGDQRVFLIYELQQNYFFRSFEGGGLLGKDEVNIEKPITKESILSFANFVKDNIRHKYEGFMNLKCKDPVLLQCLISIDNEEYLLNLEGLQADNELLNISKRLEVMFEQEVLK